MSDLGIRNTKNLLNEDQRWIHGSSLSNGDIRGGIGVTLKMSLFSRVTFPNGFVPSGVVLGKESSSGLYGPYAGRSAEVQTVTVDATGGTFTISLEGQATAAIAANATGAAVQAALEALPNVSPGDVTVVRSGSVNAYVYTITFGGRYLAQNVPAVTTGAGSLTGGASTATVATTQAGGGAVSSGLEIAAYHLLASVEWDPASTTPNLPATGLNRLTVVESFLPTGHGLDAAAKSDLTLVKYV